jgi:hypothetical protein
MSFSSCSSSSRRRSSLFCFARMINSAAVTNAPTGPANLPANLPNNLSRNIASFAAEPAGKLPKGGGLPGIVPGIVVGGVTTGGGIAAGNADKPDPRRALAPARPRIFRSISAGSVPSNCPNRSISAVVRARDAARCAGMLTPRPKIRRASCPTRKSAGFWLKIRSRRPFNDVSVSALRAIGPCGA